MSQSTELVRRLVDGIVSKLKEDLTSWRENLRLRIEAELYEVAKSVIDTYAKSIEEIEKEIMLEREHRLYTIMMDIERERLKFVEDTLDKIFDKVRDRLNQLKGTEQYKNYIRACIANAVQVIGSEEVIIQCSESDRKVVEEIANELKLNAKIETVNEELYGVKVFSTDKLVSVDLSLKARLSLIRERVKNILLKLARGG